MGRQHIKRILLDHGVTHISGALLDALSADGLEAADELARLRAALGDAFETLTYIHAASECEQSRRAAREAADKIEAALKGPSHE